MNEDRVLIIVPAYNEAGNIGRTIAEIRRVYPAGSIVVINDGSVDATACEADISGVPVVTLSFNLGIGGAVQTGFRYALMHGYTCAVQVDGDGQHDAEYIKTLLEPLRQRQVDMVIGSRFLERHAGYRSSRARRIGIHFLARLIRLLTQKPITDPTSGFRAYNRRMIELFAEYYPHDFPEPEAIMVAHRHGASVVEVSVEMRGRIAGRSSIRHLKAVYYMVKVTIALLLDMLKARKRVER